MFKEFETGDTVLEGIEFSKDEVQYNLIHLINGSAGATKLKTAADNLIYAHTKGYNPWLWIAPSLGAEQRVELVQRLAGQLQETFLPGITAEPTVARLFAETWGGIRGISYHIHMTMHAYQCPVLRQPVHVKGNLRLAGAEDADTIAGFMAHFIQDAFGQSCEPESMLSLAKAAASAGRMYLWLVQDTPVAMAQIGHRSARYGRINEVFTSRDCRKQGYASAVVAGVCAELHREGLIPMLYADAKNPDSNKVYQSLGFLEAGTIVDIKFN